MLLTYEDLSAYVGDNVNGKQVFHVCQSLVQRGEPPYNGHLAPSSARAFYFTRLALLRRQLPLRVEPDEAILPKETVECFLQTMPIVIERLEADFTKAVSILAQPSLLGRWRAVQTRFANTPEFQQALEQHTGIALFTTGIWPQLWERFWQETEQENAARMAIYLRPELLRITVVARPTDNDEKALELLRDRLRQDQLSGQSMPLPEAYLYEEPLMNWLIRPLLTETWISRLVEMLNQSNILSKGQP